MSLSARLNPDRFTGVSPKMTAIIAYVLGEEWTDPQIAWMSVSSDGYVATDADFLGECDRPGPQYLQVAHRGRLVARRT